ncbi:MAG: glycosyltransferase family 4 protein [Bacteroidales bacterium]|jgi:alpha-1,6-mannosyltransferase|nr:glycosyltransferase family 4 protein [Bacteroidales bacterium]
MNKQTVILSFWNPTPASPQSGIFIQDQAAAVCSVRDNVVFLRVNVLPSSGLLLKKEVSETAFFNNRQITVNLYSALWKFYFVNPWLLARIVANILRTRFPEIKPALIHSNVIFPCGIVAWLLSLKTGAKLVISEHWTKVGQLLQRIPYKKPALKAYMANSAIICVSDFLARQIKQHVPHNNIILIPNIVDAGIFGYRPKKPFDGANLSFVCIAMWKPPKRLDLIFDALRHLAAESGLGITLNLVGEGPQVDVLCSQSLPGNLAVVRHGAYLDKQVIASLLQSSDFFLHASDAETFSIVTAEALATGTPALVSDAGALAELVRSGNGLLAVNNPESWKKQIMQLVATGYSHETIALENRGRFSPEKVAASIINVYGETLDFFGK